MHAPLFRYKENNMSTTSITIREPAAPSKFYTFSQNNSGGHFNEDATKGIAAYVIVEAFNAEQANALAEVIGLYFDGAGDCECCGYRWSETDDYDAYPVPSIYGKPIADGWEGGVFAKNVAVHHLDGTMLWYEHGSGQDTIPE